MGFQVAPPADRPANLLFVVNDDGGNAGTAGNQSIVDRLTNHFGYHVTMVDDDSVALSDAKGQDLVVISSTVSPTKVESTFRDVPLPVLVWESGLTDDFGLSNSGSLSIFQTKIEILPGAVGHPLAVDLAAGEHTVASKSSILHTASNDNVAPGMTWIANAVNGRPAIGVVEPGGLLNSGEPAADMRITSYFGDEALASANDLGVALFDASIEYALRGRLAGPNFADHFLRDVSATMVGINSSVQVRIPFESSGELPAAMLLNMKYDDGFVAHLNGVEIARRNAPGDLTWDASATGERSDMDSIVAEQIDVTQYAGLLQAGQNVLAIQGLNLNAADEDFLLVPELIVAGNRKAVRRVYADPTPRFENGVGAAGFVSDTRFSVDRGFFDAPISVEITSATPDATIRYTTDGSPPSEIHGSMYTQPIEVDTTTNLRAAAYKEDYLPTNIDTHTYVFVEDVIQQPAEIDGFPFGGSTWAGRQAYVPQDSEMDPLIVNDVAYAEDLRSGLVAIPTMSISTDIEDVFDGTGWYDGENVEKEVSVEVLYPNQPGLSEQANAGIESHSHDRLKRSLRLNFRTEYGDSFFKTDLFQTAPLHGDTAVGAVDRIILRAGNNRSWARIWNPDKTAYTIDQFYRDSQLAMSGYGMRGNFVHLYINGVYWGLYNPVERSDRFFTSDYFGGDPEDWYIVNHGGSLSGDPTRWNYLRQTLVNRDMAMEENYEELKQYLDVESFIDYLTISWWTAASDWPQNNWYGGNRNGSEFIGPTPFQFFAWDGEWSWGQGGQSSSNGRAHVHEDFRNPSSSCPNGCPSKSIARLWHTARGSDEFMVLFADRVYRHLNHDGALTEENATARWNTLTEYIRDAVVAESARWGDSLKDEGQPTRTRDVDWQPEVNRIRGLIEGNNAQFLTALRAEGFYPSIDPPSLSQQGGDVMPGDELTLENPNAVGNVYYTIDGTDPRAVGGSPAATASVYRAPIRLDDSVAVKARVFHDGEWSALNEATFVVATFRENVQITEILYNPSPPTASELESLPELNNDDFEFIEIRNTSERESVSLVGMRFDKGVDFRFGNDTLGSRESAVVVKNLVAFRLRYGDTPRVLGQWSGSLANAGETLRLSEVDGATVFQVSYDDSTLWPASADGAGASLELFDDTDSLSSDFSHPNRWRGSVEFGGSPGAVGTEPLGVLINEVLSSPTSELGNSDSVELWNSTANSIDVSGWYLSDSVSQLFKFAIPHGTVLGPGDYVVFDESDFNPTPASPQPQHFALSGTRGDDLWLVTPSEDGIQHFVDDVRFGSSAGGLSLGRVELVPMSPVNSRLTPLSRISLGCANHHHNIGKLTISELNYGPAEPSPTALAIDSDLTARDLEFVEIQNISSLDIDISGWRIRGGIDMEFDEGTILSAGGTLVVTRFDPGSEGNANRLSAFLTHYGISDAAFIVGGYRGSLSQVGERVTLLRPSESPLDDPDFVPFVVIDEVIYDIASPWVEAIGGDALSRKGPEYFGSSSSSWNVTPATPGNASFEEGRQGDLNADATVDANDIDLLGDMIRQRSTVGRFDLDGNGEVEPADRLALVSEILQTKSGDANLDGLVDALDLNKLGLNWQQSGGCVNWMRGDLNGDLKVNALDLNQVGMHWLGQTNRVRTPRAALGAVEASSAKAINGNVQAGWRQGRALNGTDVLTTSPNASRPRDGQSYPSYQRRHIRLRSEKWMIEDALSEAVCVDVLDRFWSQWE